MYLADLDFLGFLGFLAHHEILLVPVVLEVLYHLSVPVVLEVLAVQKVPASRDLHEVQAVLAGLLLLVYLAGHVIPEGQAVPGGLLGPVVLEPPAHPVGLYQQVYQAVLVLLLALVDLPVQSHQWLPVDLKVQQVLAAQYCLAVLVVLLAPEVPGPLLALVVLGFLHHLFDPVALAAQPGPGVLALLEVPGCLVLPLFQAVLEVLVNLVVLSGLLPL